ncbi:protein EVI2B [Chanodichthys erythropterus]|uniref:protein EVI2B n=1 Tax=Chanodichthys erythropterus TaxID=933992 RepID=UPI00351E5C24
MLQRMPGFSKDTMRTTFCTLVFLFSLPWSLNGNLTTSHKNTDVTNAADAASGQITYTTDSGTNNVVSLSRSAQTQRGIGLRIHNGEDDASNKSKSRNIRDSENNFTTAAQSEGQIIQEEVTTPQKELQKPTEGSRRPHTSLLQIENATESNVSTEPPSATRTDVLREKTSRGPMETQEATQETNTSHFIELHGAQANETVLEGNKNNTNGDVHTIQPTMETTDQPNPMTHAHTSAITTATDFNKTVSTNGMKTTKRGVVTDKWTSTRGPDLKTSSMIKPTKLMSTEKTTKKQISPPSNGTQQANPGPAVAAVIGTTFVLMFIVILFILLRKRKMQRKRLENPEWAGPSPFLDGDVQPNLPNTDESETINRQSFNQVSISRYLPQRLSKHLTLGRNTSEEVLMGDILQGSTFGRQNPDEVQAPNGKPTVAQDSTEKKENEIQEGQASVDSLDTKTSVSGSAQEPVMEGKVSKQTDDLTLFPSSGTDTTVKPPTLVSIDLDSLSEEAGPLQTSDGGIVPPAPPLP